VRKGKTTGEGLKKEVRESLTGVTLVILVCKERKDDRWGIKQRGKGNH
jgi:hypothetical protein